jgi:FtsH-binding integral membrane protein
MKMRKALLAAVIIAVILMVALISTREYYVAIALGVGVLLVFRREIWHLARYRRLPPFDERIQENVKKAARNSFIYMSVAVVFLTLAYAINVDYVVDYEPHQVLSWLLISSALVYLLGYIFYDRAEPKLRPAEVARFWTFLRIVGIAFGSGITSIFLHNVIGRLGAVEEPVFFVIGVLLAPAAMGVGLIGSLVFFIKGLSRKQLPEINQPDDERVQA